MVNLGDLDTKVDFPVVGDENLEGLNGDVVGVKELPLVMEGTLMM